MESDWPETDAELESLRKRVAELESKARKLDKELAYEHGRHHLTHDRAEAAELALRKIKEAYEARSELFTSDAECAQNMADWAALALKERENP
jgi:chromosome segregation ATPase